MVAGRRRVPFFNSLLAGSFVEEVELIGIHGHVSRQIPQIFA